MGATNVQTDSEWRKRYTAAHTVLEDANALARYQQFVDQCDPAAPPTAHIFTQPEVIHRARRVCLLAGSFNPLTVAHVALAEAARAAAQLDVIIWVYTAVTIDKERVARASLPDRLGHLSTYIENATPPYGNLLALLNRGLYVDQANAIRPLLGPNTELFILVGFDKIVQIFDPRYYSNRKAALQALFAQAKLLVAPRAGAGEAELEALLARPENALYSDYVRLIPLPPTYANESSTEVREIVARGDAASSEALHQLVTPEGMALIGTGAYLPIASAGEVTVPDMDDRADVYLWRQVLVRAFARTPSPRFWHDIPPLSTLVTYTVAPDKRGAHIRRTVIRALTEPPEHASRLLRATLTQLR